MSELLQKIAMLRTELDAARQTADLHALVVAEAKTEIARLRKRVAELESGGSVLDLKPYRDVQLENQRLRSVIDDLVSEVAELTLELKARDW